MANDTDNSAGTGFIMVPNYRISLEDLRHVDTSLEEIAVFDLRYVFSKGDR
jgi:hypothetical protein